ncbi:MAG: O-antigen ligase family protein [Henriciella sp.]|nr:O-antigen ligase family protein [Henriciella sp.]
MPSVKDLAFSAAPLVLLCIALVFGGASHPGQTSHLLLQFGAALVICAALWQATRNDWTGTMFALFAIVGVFTLWALAQLVPLPPSVWHDLPGRAIVFNGASLLGAETDQHMPLSLTPARGFTDLLGLLVPLAMFFTLAAIGLRRGTKGLLWTITAFGAGSAVLGLLQVVLSREDLYFYSFTNFGFPVGFFSNVNHQATFLLMCLPFCAALIGSIRRDWTGEDADIGKIIVCSACFLLLITGVFAAGSVAGYALLAPTLVLSLLLVGQSRSGWGQQLLIYGLVVVALVGTGFLVAYSPVLDGLGETSMDDTTVSRLGIWTTSMNALDEFGLIGSGFGSYSDVYRLYEDRSAVTGTWVRLAHNDYLQTVIELGLVGVALIVSVLLLWFWLFVSAFSAKPGPFVRIRKAAAVALLVLLLHSVVDYPGRTPAILCFAALCFSVLVLPDRTRQRARKEDEQRGSHLTL